MFVHEEILEDVREGPPCNVADRRPGKTSNNVEDRLKCLYFMTNVGYSISSTCMHGAASKQVYVISAANDLEVFSIYGKS